MKNFVVLYKPIDVPMNFDSKSLQADHVQLDYLFQEMSKKHQTGLVTDIKDNYEIDKTTISFQQIGGKTCVVFVAFRK